MIINGELQNGLGGGICQVSTTVFNAAFEARPADHGANEPRALHQPLSARPRRDGELPRPRPALLNDTDHWLLLRTFVGAGSLTVNLYGTPLHRRVESTTAPLVETGPVPVKETDDPTLEKGKRVTDEVGAPPRQTSVHRLVYDANGKLLYDNTWRSFYVGEPLARPRRDEGARRRRSRQGEEAGRRAERRRRTRPPVRRARRQPRPTVQALAGRPSRLPLGRSDRLGEPGRDPRRAASSSRRRRVERLRRRDRARPSRSIRYS